MKPVRSLARRVGVQNVRRTLLAATMVFLLAASGLTVLTVEPLSTTFTGGGREEAYSVQVADDGDGDGIPDAVENLIGSDPDTYATLDGDVPDGYIHHHFTGQVDWSDPGLLEMEVLRPEVSDLPEPLQQPGAVRFPTIAELYDFDHARHEDMNVGGAWWLQGTSIDPHEWDNDGDGIADAWLIQHGFDPISADADASAPGDPGMNLRQKYHEGLDPTLRDTDGDGLWDTEELAGDARFADKNYRFTPTDPRRNATRGDGIVDGFIVRFDLDPHDPQVGGLSPAADGLTVTEAYLFTADHCSQTHDGNCPWRQRLDEGPLLDPTTLDSFGDGVPDVWSLRDPHRVAHPFKDMRTHIIATTEAWDTQPWTGDPAMLSGVVIDDANTAPDAPFEVSVADAYAHLRPQDWDEDEDGAWWNGLPTKLETREGELPPAVALRGWNLTIDRGLGGIPDPQTIHAHADPRRSDTSGDGLLDLHEYYGVSSDGKAASRTNPADPDTDGDQLPDAEELQFGTDPLKRDTSQSFLTDGFEKDYWTERLARATARFQEDPDVARQAYAWLDPDGGDPTLLLDRLGPLGDLTDDGIPNILAASADGDALKDGAELFPNMHLEMPSGHVRPVTDPARLDTDEDGLPDAWEVSWSLDRYYDCGAECKSPISGAKGWPLDPSKLKSIDVTGRESDFDINLAADTISLPGGGKREFTSGQAYVYDLHPYRNDTSGDDLTDMFTIEYGVETVPGPVADLLNGDAPPAWVAAATARVNERLEQIGRSSVPVAVLDPAQAHDGAPGPDADLLSTFDGREKGTWVYQVAPCPSPLGLDHAETLPGTGLRSEVYGDSEWSGANDIRPRAGLDSGPGCWKWAPQSLADDQELGTNPWLHGSGTASEDSLLPDAWRDAYDISQAEDPGSVTSGSLAAGCSDQSRHDGLPPAAQIPGKLATQTFCLTMLETYLFGLDPASQDTDGGGMPDWLEAALDLQPLDKNDDDPHGDWDGDGLTNLEEILRGTNPLAPDSDRDGLADGGTLTCHGPSATGSCPGSTPAQPHPHYRAGGDLCLHKSGDQEVPRTGQRPGGPLTRSQMYALYVDAGILHVEGAGNGCPAGMVRFLVEGRFDPDTNEVLGAGVGSDPTRVDTSGDGLPDGWTVYWRIHGHSDFRNRFDPTAAIAAEDPDDGVGTFAVFSNLEEYRIGRPSDWDESSDGPWWGGTDPTRRDTTGTRDWFEPRTSGEDLDDRDADSDGLTGLADPYPVEHGNGGQVIEWSDAQGRYITDYSILWDAISRQVRADNQFIDSDGTGVPDWLDRARVAVVDLAADGTMVKGAATATVTGRVVLTEPHVEGLDDRDSGAPGAGDGTGVVGATVRLVANDDNGDAALVGAGFTKQGGLFEITAAADATLQAPPVPAGGAVLAGRIWDEGDTPSLQTALDGGPSALGLQPGRLEIRAIVDPNDSGVQTLSFGTEDTARAYKPVSSGNPYPLPDGRAVRAVIVDDGDDGPEPLPHHGVTHTTQAIFGTKSQPVPASLASATHVTLDQVPQRVVLGRDGLTVAGRFVDAEDVGLPGRNVELELVDEHGTRVESDLKGEEGTDADGIFEFTVDPLAFAVGDLTVRAQGVLRDEGDEFLEEPDVTTAAVALARETHWTDIAIDGQPLGGKRPELQPDERFTVTARLIDDHLETPVPGRPVQVELLRGLATTPVWAREVTTTGDGRISVEVQEISLGDDPALHHVRLREVPHGQSSHRDSTFTVEPRYPTTLEIDDVRMPVGHEGFLSGRLTAQGQPVVLPEASFIVAANDGQTATHTGTDQQGRFAIPVSSEVPGRLEWTVGFTGATLFAPSDSVVVNSTHHVATVLKVEDPIGLRSQNVTLSGRLVDDLGDPVTDAHVHLSWLDGTGDTGLTTDDEGRFDGMLPARPEIGQVDARISFNGTSIFDPSSATVTVPIHLPTSVGLEMDDVRLGPDDADRTVARAVLRDERGDGIPGRLLQVEVLAYPLDCRGDGASACVPMARTRLQKTTGADGSVSLDPADLSMRHAGVWRVTASFAGAANEVPSSDSARSVVRHLVQVNIDRMSERAAQGDEILLEGHVKGVLDDMRLGAIRLDIGLAGVPHKDVTVQDPDDLRVHYRVPMQAAVGPQNVTVIADGAAGYRFSPWQGQLVVLQGVHVDVRETVDNEGRTVHITVVGADGRSLSGEAQLVLLRRDNATNRILGLHRIGLDLTTGEATLDLSDAREGNLSMVSLRGPSLEALQTEYTIHTSLVPVEGSSGGMPGWLITAGIALATAMALAVLTAYIIWRERGRRRLQEAIVEAHRALLDPELDPAEVVRRTYQQLLLDLEAAGHVAADGHTVRDIAASAIDAFRLPPRPMHAVSKLFERVVYAELDITESGRREALDAFFRLARDLGTPERSLGGGSP